MSQAQVVPNGPTLEVKRRERNAKIFGVLLSIFTLAMVALSIYEARHLLKGFVYMAIATYLIAVVIFYWLSGSFLDGITAREARSIVLCPRGFYLLNKEVRASGVSGGVGSIHINAQQDTSKRLIKSTFGGILFGLLLTAILGVATVVLLILALVHLAIAFIWMVIGLWSVADAVYFWGGRVYKNGIGIGEVFVTVVLGPFALMWLTVKSAFRKRQLESQPAPVVVA